MRKVKVIVFNMLLYVAVHCVFLVWIELSDGGVIPNYNVSVSHLQNPSGRPFVEAHLEHEDEQLWDLYIGRTSKDTVAKIVPPEKDVSTQKTCHPPPALGYEFVPGLGYYKTYGDKNRTNWKAAKEFCEQEGGHLIVNSEFEARAVMLLISTNSDKTYYFWNGFHDQYKEGEYVTIYNETLQSTGFNKTYFGGLTGGTGQNCGGFYYYANKYGLIDTVCGNNYPFICEHEI